MDDLTALDVAFRGALDGDLLDVFQKALEQSRVLTVAAGSPAPLLAHSADAMGAEVISVVDQSHNAIGYIFPGWVTKQVSAHVLPVGSLTTAVDVLGQEIRTPGRAHIHEWLNFDRPQPRICPGNGTPHKTFFDPCLIDGHN